jgi:hypothetical protein
MHGAGDLKEESYDGKSEIPCLIDEGWWESVLAEESRYSTRPSVWRRTSRGPAGSGEGILGAASGQLGSDQGTVHGRPIIDLTVTGHNRGGLLVEGEWAVRFRSFFAFGGSGRQRKP